MSVLSGKVFGFGRRDFLASMTGLAGMAGVSHYSSAFAENDPASATNPKRVYSFNPRGTEAATLCDNMSFSRSGKYLAIVNNSAMYSKDASSAYAAFSVWDVEARNCVFKVTDPQLIHPLTINSAPMWGPNDAWVSTGVALGDGNLVWFDPKSGIVLNKIQVMWGKCQINDRGTKILTSRIPNGLNIPSITIYDTDDDSKTPIPLENCLTGRQLAVLATAWLNNDTFFSLGYNAISTSNTCTDVDIALSTKDHEEPTKHYFTAVIDCKSKNTILTRNNDDGPPIGQTAAVNFKNSLVYLSSEFVFNGKTLDTVPLQFEPNFIPSGQAAFSPDGALLYVPTFMEDVRLPSGLRKVSSGIFDPVTGLQVGHFPAAMFRTHVAISPDGRYMALARDLEVEIYRLL